MRESVQESRKRFLRDEPEWCPSPGATRSCDPDTGHSCNKIVKCKLLLGPTKCNSTGLLTGKCFCKEGYCPNADGVCMAAFSNITADVVPVSAAQPNFPGRHAGVRTGLCFSGGGIRATTWALGGLRLLVKWGLMDNVDIISSVSGGSWANAIYMFAPGDTQTILGGPTDPANLTMEVLNEEPAPGIKTATNDPMAIVMRLVLRGAPLDTLWQFFVCEAFLKPFGLCDFWAYLAPDADAVEKIKRANPQLKGATFQHPRADRPRAMVIDGTKLAPHGYETDAGDDVSFQMSPDYIGSPFYASCPENGTSGYIKYDSLYSNQPAINRLVGGGFVEAYAFGGGPSRKGQGGGKGVTLGAPPWPFSLAQAIGVSSMAVGAALGNIPFVGFLVDPNAGYWPVTDADHPSEHGLLVSKLSDGGNEENSGMLPLLQRGVKKIVWFAASYKLVNRSYNLCTASTSDDELVKAGVIDQVLDKFGYGPELTEGSPNALLHNQVFDRPKVHNVVCQLQQHLTSGTPPVLHFQEEVLRNDWWGIAGGWTVEIVLVYLEHSANFEAQLPQDTQAQLALKTKGAFPGYPAYATAAGGGTNAEYNLLAATSEYFIRQNEDLVRSILS